MQQRIEAMVTAVGIVKPPLEKFYGLLDDEQKARLNALAENQRKEAAARDPNATVAQSCGAAQPAMQEWPTGEIDARLQLSDTQRGALQVLQDASADAARKLKAACQTNEAMTPPARLAFVAKRLDVMNVLVADPYVTIDDAAIRHLTLDDLLARADYVVCLAIANAQTENLIGQAALARMPKHAFFINLSRGNLVDEAALSAALRDGRIAGAAMDVGRAPDQMPTPELAKLHNVIATPHGYFTP